MKNTLKAELHQAFHNRFFYISFFLMLAFSVFGVFFMELPRESGFDLWRQYRFDENGAPLTTLFLPATGLYCKWLGGDAGQFTTAAFYFLVFLVCTVPFSWSLVSEKQSGYESHILLDEPTNALDVDGVAMVKKIIQKEKDRGALIILCCHDPEVLNALADEIYHIQEGKLASHHIKEETA